MAKKKAKRKVARPTLPMQRHLNLCHEGRYFDLRRIFERVNERHFRGRLRGYRVIWGSRRKERPKEYFIFGSIQEEDRVIRIHPLARSAVRAALVPRVRALPRDAAFRGAGGNRFGGSPPHSHRGILSSRKSFPALSSRPPLGRRKSRALPALSPPPPNELRQPLAVRINQTARVSLLRSS